jgi:hypothetical protein
MLRHWLALTPATEGQMAGYSPLGPDHGVRVGKEAHDRSWITHAVASETGEEARQCLHHGKDRGLHGTAAFADYSPSCTAALTAVAPQARLPADQVHTVQTIWGPLKNSLLSSRRQIKSRGEAQKEEAGLVVAQKGWTWRWSLRKQPSNFSVEDKQAMAEWASEAAGFVPRCRTILRQLVHIFDHAHSEAPATLRLQQLRQDSHALAAPHLEKSPQCFDAHWDHAWRYLRKKGMGTHRRGAHSASGMRLLRRLEKNHDGLRSAATRQHYTQLYQAMKYLSLDVADFIEKGPQLAELPDE